jgi:XRE family transcriptional regulator, aerobic/anaerobic benzoate catabolism transcriptional regulator
MLPEQVLLTELGQRLREQRRIAGLSTVELAESADVSRRYVTEAEAGRANLSLLKLAALATALRIPLRQLCDLPLGGVPERVALVGLRGAGKSTIGRALALELEVPFVELDERVQELSGTDMASLFEARSEAHLANLEREALETVLSQGQRIVLAAGGSIVHRADTYARLLATTRSVWLRAEPEEHFERVLAQGDSRPMDGRPHASEELRALLGRREPLYARCEVEISTSGRTVDQVVRTALEALS